MLQSEDYAREVIHATWPDLTKPELDRRVDARMTRKINLLGSKAPTLHVLMDEGALNRPIGGPEIMASQLGDILHVMDWPNVTVQVLPLATGAHTGLEGAFSVLSFGDEDPDIGYAECPAGEVYVEAIDQIRNLMLMFERLARACLSHEKSAALIAAARRES